jgi:CSLREA domain-containing protein
MAAMLIAPVVAQAATITVNTSADTSMGECTLRDAITAANNNAVTGACPAGQPSPTVDLIDFSVPGGSTISLGSALPAISSDVDIQVQARASSRSAATPRSGSSTSPRAMPC